MENEEIMMLLEEIPHPAINYSLNKLGILTNIQFENNQVNAVFAFPFAVEKIPIADRIIQSVAITLGNFNISFDHSIRIMNDSEKQKFLKLEHEAWKGL
jgi:metal-sulfur cluster biosynthetic enzyme